MPVYDKQYPARSWASTCTKAWGAVRVQDGTVTLRVKRAGNCYVERLLCEDKLPRTVEQPSELVGHDESLI